MYFFSLFGPRIVQTESTNESPSQFIDLFRNFFTIPQQTSTGLPLTEICRMTTLEIYEAEPNRMMEEGKANEIQCSICHCDFENGQIIRRMNSCNHIFHHQCIDQWFTTHQSCPLCRANMSSTPHEETVHEFTIPISFLNPLN